MPHIPLDSLDIDSLPPAEDDAFEYKSSRTPLDKLKEKIKKAASAFANSGGGCFIAGEWMGKAFQTAEYLRR
jgi:hypothetical protein